MSSPVGYTCPMIDTIIESVVHLLEVANKEENISDDLWDAISDVEAHCTGRRSTLEEIRDANDALRKWGGESLEEQVAELTAENEQISILQDRIDDLQSDLDSVEYNQ